MLSELEMWLKPGIVYKAKKKTGSRSCLSFPCENRGDRDVCPLLALLLTISNLST